MKCGASKDGEGNNGKSLSCNDECAKLERNRKLALALNIDQSTHVVAADHIPYSTDTLNLFAQKPGWGQNQEREFRVFATSDDEKRLRFKPMKAQDRAFIHHLAEDFGFDSESMDPEPHRHVMIWKTPRFVSPPSNTLAEALRVRAAQRSATASANVSDSDGPATASKKTKASNETGEPYNGFVINNPRFALTVDEVRAELNHLLHSGLAVAFEVEFLPTEQVVLKGVSRTPNPQDIEKTLMTLKGPLVSAIATKGFGTMELCTLDASLNIVRRESDSSAANGWATVAGKKAGPRAPVQNSGGFAAGNSFAALTGGGGGVSGNGKVTFAKKTSGVKTKPRKESVVEDWETAEAAEEEREKGPGAGDELVASHPNANEKEADVSHAAVAMVETDTEGEIAPGSSALHALEEEPIAAKDWASQVELEAP